MRSRLAALALVLGCLLLAGGSAFAQAAPETPGPDPIGQNLFPPDLVFAQAGAIGLTDTQKANIQSAVLGAQSRFVLYHPRLQQATQTMGRLLGQSRVADAQVLAQLDKVLSLEREVKRTQIGLMVRIKNILTPDQQAKLRQLRSTPAPH
jgi:Spy/CpxP family protein refolding chaperone